MLQIKTLLMRKFIKIKYFTLLFVFLPSVLLSQNKTDTSYISIAPVSVQKLLVNGKAPVVTLQLSGYYDIGLTDLASNDNAKFQKADFINGRDYGTRYGWGISLTGKISLQKEGYLRLLVSSAFNKFQSYFIVGDSPDGRVSYNVFSWGLGLENNFTPDRKLKYYVGFEIVPSLIYGTAELNTDSSVFNLKIKNSFRLGLSANFGFEYAFSNYLGMNFGMKFTHVNILLKESKASSNPNEIYLNDDKTNLNIPYAGWKQFFYTSFYTGLNFYFGAKNKR
jgi:hypothetical protein